MTVVDAILHYNPGITVADINNLDSAKGLAKALGIPLKDSWGLGKVQIEIFERPPSIAWINRPLLLNTLLKFRP